MANSSDFGRISVPFRVAAWVLFVGSAAVLVDLLIHIRNLKADPPADSFFSGVAGTLGLVMWGYVALRGRSPAALLMLQNGWNSRLGIKPSFNPSSRLQLLCWIVAVLTGTALVAAADASELFGDEIRGLVFLIYAIAGLAVMALVWRLARFPPNNSLQRTREE
jgi:hypothetical protein